MPAFNLSVIEAQVLDDTFAAPLRRETASWPNDWRCQERLEAARRRLIYHGVAGLLLEQRALLSDWPEPILSAMRNETVAHAMWELRHKFLVSDLVETLHDAGIASVLLKGTALAYSVYDNPALRFRGDSDLLIREKAVDVARNILSDLGWNRPDGAPGPFGPMHYQEIWQYRDPAGFAHNIDLHWEVTNSVALKSVLAVDEVIDMSVPLADLSENAQRPDLITALIHRSINRAIHARSGYFSIDRYEYGAGRLSWAVDTDLIARKFSEEEWGNLCRKVCERGVGPVCADALSFTANALNTPVPVKVMETLSKADSNTAPMRFLNATREREMNVANLKATSGFVAQLLYILARLIPAPSHLRKKYPHLRHWPLIFLYARRLGAAIICDRSKATEPKKRPT
ncbi:nucleotidyltransferase family protein [Aurantiacibacter rhizosphaerae]|nr:nucleotidyltransferase family protein [Aurantiacibacter rhizosphaerae]